MLISVKVTEKSFGSKILYNQLEFDLQEGEKIGLIGRNGIGKSTLINLISGLDTDFQGEIKIKGGTIMVTSRQEHHEYDGMNTLDYIQGDLPEFAKLHHIITTYPDQIHDNKHKLQVYSDAIERFSTLGYFEVEEELAKSFSEYQLDRSKLEAKLGDLSGGEKRMVELIKVQRSRGDIALIDEPTNHMDYVAKKAFIKWMTQTKEAVLVITHDRDVLGVVDRLIEIRDGRAYTFKGNYIQYLKINKNQTTSQVNEFDLTQRRIINLKDDLIRFRRFKEKARDPGTIQRFKRLEQNTEAELLWLGNIAKPSIWIDRESAGELNPKMAVAYSKYKSKNIVLDTKGHNDGSSRLLVRVIDLSLGYNDTPLFKNMTFSLHEGERVRLHGRNGAGKTTLVKAIMARLNETPIESVVFSGSLITEPAIKVGHYEQEIDAKYLDMTLATAIEAVADEQGVQVNDQRIKQLMSNYLFNPIVDGPTQISRLSGGQKARFQIIKMLINDPQILILDEVTNHMDLPSIEELEDAMGKYGGAIIYISHDSFFASRLKGKPVVVGQ